MDNNSVNLCHLTEILTNRTIKVYGTGYVADNFYNALKIHRLTDNIECFIETFVEGNRTSFKGKPLIAADKVKVSDNSIICIAVHEAIKDEIENLLKQLGHKNFIWVHPYIFELVLGKKIKSHVLYSIKDILLAQGNTNFFIAVRYIAIEEYFGENDYGYSIYKKAMCLQCGPLTAEKRLNNFICLMHNWVENGYLYTYPILIDEAARLLDGNHRVAMAVYMRQKNIYADVLPYSENYGLVAKTEDLLPEWMLTKEIFTMWEIEKIRETQNVIWRSI